MVFSFRFACRVLAAIEDVPCNAEAVTYTDENGQVQSPAL